MLLLAGPERHGGVLAWNVDAVRGAGQVGSDHALHARGILVRAAVGRRQRFGAAGRRAAARPLLPVACVVGVAPQLLDAIEAAFVRRGLARVAS